MQSAKETSQQALPSSSELSGLDRGRTVVKSNFPEKNIPKSATENPPNLTLAELVLLISNRNSENMNQSKKMDRLSVFLEKIAFEYNQHNKKDSEETLRRVKIVLESVFEFLFRADPGFKAIFDKPDPETAKHDGIESLVHENNDSYKCRIFLKKFTHPGSCQVLMGPQDDVPPGVAICKLNEQLTNEEKSVIHDQWALCMNHRGYVTPDLIFPWFSREIVRAVKCLAEPEDIDSSDEDEEMTEEERIAKLEKNPWLGIHAYADFPSVYILLPKKQKRYHSQNEELEEKGRRLSGFDLSAADDRPPLTRDGASDIGDQVGEGKPPEMDDDERSFNSGDGIEPTFTTISITPCIQGIGWLKGIQLQHAFPKLKPLALKGVESLAEFQEKLEDGQPMWFLEASHENFAASSVSLGPRFAATLREVGSRGSFWNFCTNPTLELLERHLVDACAKNQFPVDIAKLKGALGCVSAYHKWTCITSDIIDSCVLWVMKRHMTSLQSLSACFKKTLEYLCNAAKRKSCPSFLMPNVNILKGIDLVESKKIPLDIDSILKDIEEDESCVLKYCGFGQKKKKYGKKYNVDN